MNRRIFIVSGAAALTVIKGRAATPSCILNSEQEEGPYYVDGAKLRSDITEGTPGMPLTLRVALVDSRTCAPLTNAALDIWHCDASGVYSGFTASNPGGFGRGPAGPGGRGPRVIDETRFLRGVQVTGKQGLAEFSTVYPGWYQGRAIHIHVKVHVGEGNGHVAHTGQLFFPEDVTEQIAKTEPYAKRLSVHRTTQQEDMVFGPQHGSDSLVHLDRNQNAYIAMVTLAVDPEATPQPVGAGGGRGRGGPGGRGRGPGGPPPF